MAELRLNESQLRAIPHADFREHFFHPSHPRSRDGGRAGIGKVAPCKSGAVLVTRDTFVLATTNADLEVSMNYIY